MTAGTALRPTRTRYAVLVLVYLAAFITYLDRVCISVAAPAMQADLRLSQIQFAWVFTVFYIAYGVFEIPTAWLGDHWGQRRMLIRIVGCWSLFTIFTGMARSLATLLMTRTVFGAAEAGAFPALSRALSRWFPLHERSRANGVMWMGARSGGQKSLDIWNAWTKDAATSAYQRKKRDLASRALASIVITPKGLATAR